MSKHRKHFGFKFQYRAVKDLYGNDHGLARSDQPFVVKDAKAGARIKGLFFKLVKFDRIVSGWGDCRILFDLGYPRAVDSRDAADVHERLNVLISPALRQEGLYNALLFGCQAAFPLSYSHVGDLPTS
jgi:hypothetical protein